MTVYLWIIGSLCYGIAAITLFAVFGSSNPLYVITLPIWLLTAIISTSAAAILERLRKT